MTGTEYNPQRRGHWRWIALGVCVVIVVLVAMFMASGRPAPGWLSHASEEDLKRLHAKWPTDNEIGYYYARSLMRDGESGQAYRLMTEVAKRAPNSTRYLTKLAEFATQRGRAREALKLYRRVVEMEPGNANAHAEMAHMFTEAGLLSEGLQQYDLARKFNPTITIDPALFAQCLVHSGRNQEAWDQLIPWLAKIPRQDEPYETLTQAGIKLGKLDETEFLVLRRVNMDTIYPLCRFHYCLAQIEFARPRTPKTLKEAHIWASASTQDRRHTKEQFPIRPEYFAFYARVLKAENRQADARSALQKGLGIDATNLECLGLMAKLEETVHGPKTAYWKSAYARAAGETEEITRLRRETEQRPADTVTALKLATALERKERYVDAAQICHNLLETSPGQHTASDLLLQCQETAMIHLEREARQRYNDLDSSS